MSIFESGQNRFEVEANVEVDVDVELEVALMTGLVRIKRPPFCGALSLSAKIGTVRRLRAHEKRAVKAQVVVCLEF